MQHLSGVSNLCELLTTGVFYKQCKRNFLMPRMVLILIVVLSCIRAATSIFKLIQLFNVKIVCIPEQTTKNSP